MNKHCFLFLLIIISFLNLISCNRSNDIFIYSPPDTSTIPPQPYTIKVSKYYDSLFATDPFGADNVQDFDIYDNVLYVWAFSAFGLYEYHLNDGTLIHRGVSYAGDCIAADSGQVFWAGFGGTMVFSYSLEDSQSSIFIDPGQDYSVHGFQVYENKLYVLLEKENTDPDANLLKVYDLKGNLIESLPYPRETWYMAINNGILYSVAYDTVQKEQVLSRFNLNSGQFLKDVENPSLYCDGIRSYGDYFFFTDYEKEMIGYVLLDEIEQRGK